MNKERARRQGAVEGRRGFLRGAVGAAGVAANAEWGGVERALSSARPSALPPEGTAVVRAEIEKRHDESVKRLQTWIKQPSIAAENRGMNEGCELMMEMLRESGFGRVQRMPTDGQPGVFAVLDAGAPKT